MSAKPPKSAPFAVKLAYYAEGPVDVRLCAQMKYHHRECRGHLVDRYCPTIRGHIFNSGPCKDWHTPERALRAGQKILAAMRGQLVDLALEEAMTKAANEPLTDEELAIIDVAYERGKVSLAEVRINMLQRRIGALQAERDDLLSIIRSTDPIQAANCRVLEYHQLKEEVERLEREASVQRDEIEILTTVRNGWQQKCRAAEGALRKMERGDLPGFGSTKIEGGWRAVVRLIQDFARAALSSVCDQEINDRGYNPKPIDQPQPIITPPPPRPTDPESAGRSNP